MRYKKGNKLKIDTQFLSLSLLFFHGFFIIDLFLKFSK